MADALDGDTGVLSVKVGDRLLLCSDGLTNEVSDTELAELASSPIGLDDAVASLVARACANGGHDNITVALLEVVSVSVVVPEIVVTPSSVRTIPASRVATSGTGETLIRRRRKNLPRWLTWRTGIFASAMTGLVAAVFVILGWFASSSFYLGDANGSIAVYQGQPNGFLWYHPKEVFVTSFKSAELRPGDARELKKHIAESSLSAAIRHVDNMHSAWLATQPVVAP
jgi:protein phosphatase